VNDIDKWENIDWLTSARRLVEWVNQRSSDERFMIFLRHSEREVIEDHSEQFSTGLTEIGKQMSFEMGMRLPTDKPIRIFFSFVSRCYETVEELAKGLKENDGEIVEFESEPLLVMPEYSEESVWDNLQPDGENVTEFVNRWANGEFGDRIQYFEDYKLKLLKHTFGRLKEEKEPFMHVHVTHDLALMAIKRILLQRPIGYEDRESFQGGICCTIDKEGSFYLYNSGEETDLVFHDLNS
jgi:broad specificity phosphatase PhoE